MSDAIKPSFYSEFTTEVEKAIDEKIVTEDQLALSYITHFKGWTLLKDYKDRLNEFLDTSLSNAIASGASAKEIGERALVKELAKFVLNSFVEKADEARRATDK
jgi:hypothetical protein